MRGRARLQRRAHFAAEPSFTVGLLPQLRATHNYPPTSKDDPQSQRKHSEPRRNTANHSETRLWLWGCFHIGRAVIVSIAMVTPLTESLATSLATGNEVASKGSLDDCLKPSVE